MNKEKYGTDNNVGNKKRMTNFEKIKENLTIDKLTTSVLNSPISGCLILQCLNYGNCSYCCVHNKGQICASKKKLKKWLESEVEE